MTWLVDRKGDDHIFPAQGADDHTASVDCFCVPFFKHKDPVTFRRVIMHRFKNIDPNTKLPTTSQYCAYCSKKIPNGFSVEVKLQDQSKLRTYSVHQECEFEFIKNQGLEQLQLQTGEQACLN